MGWNLERGVAELRRSIELAPNAAMTWAWLSNLLPLLNRNADAQDTARRAMQLDPLSPLVGILATLTFIETDSWAEASQSLERSLELEPLSPGFLLTGLLQQRDGQFDEAVASMERGAELSERSPFITSYLGGALARAGREAEARAILDEFEAANVDAWFRAIVHWHLGDEATAFGLIEHGLREHNSNMLTHVRMPGLQKLHADSRWSAALQRTGLPAV
jgi:predicted Zn-dependent protease